MTDREFTPMRPKANIVACKKVPKGEKKTYVQIFGIWEDGTVRVSNKTPVSEIVAILSDKDSYWFNFYQNDGNGAKTGTRTRTIDTTDIPF